MRNTIPHIPNPMLQLRCDGNKVVNPQVLSSVYPLLDAEAIRLVSSIPDFIPGKHNGKPANVQFVLPCNFVLDPDNLIQYKKENGKIMLRNR